MEHARSGRRTVCTAVLPRRALQVLPRLQNIQHQRTLKIGVSPLSVNKVGEMGPAALWAGYG